MAETSILRKMNLIFRFSYTFVFTFASLCGALYAYLNYDVPLHILTIIPLTVMVMALFVNFSNDYFDHVSGVDDLRFNNENKENMLDGITDSNIMRKLYWDGNPVNNGLVTREQAKIIMIVLVAMAVALSIPIILYGGWKVIALGVFGILIAYFYTAPPVNLGARGLGELSVAISFFLMVFASYYVASGYEWNEEIFVFALLIGVMVGHMRIVDSMTGQDAHIAANERSVSVMVGLDRMGVLIKVMLIATYVLAAVMVYFNLIYIILFATLPLAMLAWKVVTKREKFWEIKTAPITFLMAFLTELIFIVIQIVLNFI